jgi:hypothetical protein
MISPCTDRGHPFALLMIVVELCRYGLHAPSHDEGTPDHTAIMLWFVATRRHSVSTILPTLVIQLSLWTITFASASPLPDSYAKIRGYIEACRD